MWWKISQLHTKKNDSLNLNILNQIQDIKEIKQGVYYNLYDVIKRIFGSGTPLPKTFFYE